MARKQSQACEREECGTHTALAPNRRDCSTAAGARDHIMTPCSVGTEGRKTGKVYLANYFLILFPFCERQVLKTNIVGKWTLPFKADKAFHGSTETPK